MKVVVSCIPFLVYIYLCHEHDMISISMISIFFLLVCIIGKVLFIIYYFICINFCLFLISYFLFLISFLLYFFLFAVGKRSFNIVYDKISRLVMLNLPSFNQSMLVIG